MFGRKFAPTDILIIGVLAALAVFIAWRIHSQNAALEQASSAAPLRLLKGAAKVEDGDSLKINRQRVRLVGIDAPELHQSCYKDGSDYACGVMAGDYLRGLIGSSEVECRWAEKDKYKRVLGHCFAGEIDLNRAMVLHGWAVSYSYAAEGDNTYKREEQEARAAKRGIWQGRFQKPKAWRKEHPRL